MAAAKPRWVACASRASIITHLMGIEQAPEMDKAFRDKREGRDKAPRPVEFPCGPRDAHTPATARPQFLARLTTIRSRRPSPNLPLADTPRLARVSHDFVAIPVD